MDSTKAFPKIYAQSRLSINHPEISIDLPAFKLNLVPESTLIRIRCLTRLCLVMTQYLVFSLDTPDMWWLLLYRRL